MDRSGDAASLQDAQGPENRWMHGACGCLDVLPGARSWQGWPMGRAACCFCSHPVPACRIQPHLESALLPGSSHGAAGGSCAAGSKLGVLCAPRMSLQAGKLLLVPTMSLPQGWDKPPCPPQLPSAPSVPPAAAGPHSIAFPWQRLLPSLFQSELEGNCLRPVCAGTHQPQCRNPSSSSSSISPAHCQGQQCLPAPHSGRVKKPPPPPPELCQREDDSFVPWDGSTQGQQVWLHFPAHSASSQGFIPEPAQKQQWSSCSLPPVRVCWALGKGQPWGLCCGLLSGVAGKQEGTVPVPAPLGLAEVQG